MLTQLIFGPSFGLIIRGKGLFAGTLPANKNVFARTLPANKNEFARTIPTRINEFAGTISLEVQIFSSTPILYTVLQNCHFRSILFSFTTAHHKGSIRHFPQWPIYGIIYVEFSSLTENWMTLFITNFIYYSSNCLPVLKSLSHLIIYHKGGGGGL